MSNGDALHFVEEAYKHYKSIAASAEGRDLIIAALGDVTAQPGVVAGASASAITADFVAAIAVDRHWSRSGTERVSA